jgi:predicted MFS family arabinose efflux permease
MTGVVLGLVEAGSSGWGDPLTFCSLIAGVLLLTAFVRIEARAEEPILPLRLLSNSTRNTANVARGLVYAGMYGMFFFLSQFLQDVEGYSPLRAGVAFLAVPTSVFLASQITSRYLMARVPRKPLMLSGIALATVSLLLASRLHAGTSYPHIFLCLVLLGLGTGISLVSLTSASLAGVAQSDAGAASGLVNAVQQLGAAFGLAVLVTVFGGVTHHAQFGTASSLASAQAQSVLVHGLDDAFTAGAVFAVLALALVALVVRPVVRPVLVLSAVEVEAH